jgi:hypothetical protein
MSSTIDAAIIKALVEHIGGNPDTIPDGTIGGGGGDVAIDFSKFRMPLSDTNIAWELAATGNTWNVRLSEEYIPRIGDILRLYHPEQQKIITFVCVSLRPKNGEGMMTSEYSFVFKGLDYDGEIIGSAYTESAQEIKIQFQEIKGFNTPDNVETGLFTYNANSNNPTIMQLLFQVFNGISSVLQQILIDSMY